MSGFPIDAYALPDWAQERGVSQRFAYNGPSMNPIFHDGDFLYVCPVEKKLMAGDVIVFSNPEEKIIVHRVVSVLSIQKLLTKGDNNRLYDLPISLDQVIGKVEFVENKIGVRKVLNGYLGLSLTILLRIKLLSNYLIRQAFWRLYIFIREKQIVKVIWRPKISKIRIRSENSGQMKYVYRNRTVAVWDESSRQLQCRKPFDLVILFPDDCPQ